MRKRSLILSATTAAVATIAAAPAGISQGAGASQSAGPTERVRSVEFVGMAPPATPRQKASVYTTAKVKVTYATGTTRTYTLAYNQLMATGQRIGGKVVGGLFDSRNKPLMDAKGQIASTAPDGTSLIKVPGLAAANPTANNGLALVTQYEYRGLRPAGPGFTEDDYWSKLPATMSLARINQNKDTGALAVAAYNTISFAAFGGLWIPCAASLSPWNTHLSSEEYEPDAKTREGLPAAADSDDATDISSFSKYFFGNPRAANPYNYGIVPEVVVRSDGSRGVKMHYALGRIARELVDVQPDRRTAYMGDDGAFTGFFLFVADRRNDLSSGTLYAGKWHQTSAAGSNGGAARISWIKLGHGTDSEINALVKGGIKFSDIFAVRLSDPHDASFTKVHTYTGTEWLKLKPGKAKAAAFLETRRYAAYRGATTEFNKFEGTTHNAADKKAYVVMSRVEDGMADTEGDIKLAENKGGATYRLDLTSSATDEGGNAIASNYVVNRMTAIPALLGKYHDTEDANGNRCVQNRVCGGDNLKFSEGMRTLFIGEDTGYRNNNYVWAYNVDTGKLSRILSVPMGAEATGLQAVDNYNGSAYIMSNFQHPGDGGDSDPDWPQIEAMINSMWNNKLKAAIGYIGTTSGDALPAMTR
ncbi:MAG: alkaline phosphatase PhoX [Tetrasphaera sp.]